MVYRESALVQAAKQSHKQAIQLEHLARYVDKAVAKRRPGEDESMSKQVCKHIFDPSSQSNQPSHV